MPERARDEAAQDSSGPWEPHHSKLIRDVLLHPSREGKNQRYHQALC